MENNKQNIVTDKIYERDAYVKSFAATVLSCEKEEDRYAVILDVTSFFPEGGGQSSDTGRLNEVIVSDVKLIDGDVIHYTKEPLEVGAMVTGEIDWQRRFRKMQNHTAEHLLCGIIHNAYGMENVGFHMDDEEVTFDVDGELTIDQLKEIEKRANEAVYENVAITVSFPEPEMLKTLEYRSKLDLSEGVRLVTIENYDVCACCAPHVANTGEIGVIKIIDFFMHRGGTRITMRAGISAYEDYARIDEANKGISALLSSKRYETYEFSVKSDEKYHALIEENIRLKRLLSGNESKAILERMAGRSDDDKSPELIFSETLDRVQMRNIINSITEKYEILVGGFIGNDANGYDYIIGRGINLTTNLSVFAKEINAACNGSGGGKPEMIQGHLNANKKEIEKFLN